MIHNQNHPTLFPPSIIYRRIEISLKSFYTDLKTFCKTMGWRCDPYVSTSDGKVIKWKNNLVEIEQIEQYDDGRAKGFLFTYRIPSPIGPPFDSSKKANITDNIPQIGYKHKIYVSLPYNYPSVRSIESSVQRTDTLYIESRSQLFHPRFYLREKSWGCIMINGEIDRIAMNLFQQLLWEPGHIWKENPLHETTNNMEASLWAKNCGKQEIHKLMINLMTRQWSV